MIGSCELLNHSKLISASSGLIERPSHLRLSHKRVLCVIDYQVEGPDATLHGCLQRRNKGSAGGAIGAAPSIAASAVDRSACAEFRALSGMYKLMPTGAHGSVKISVTEPPCVACVSAVLQFSQEFPQVRIQACIDGALFRFGEEIHKLKTCKHVERTEDDAKGSLEEKAHVVDLPCFFGEGGRSVILWSKTATTKVFRRQWLVARLHISLTCWLFSLLFSSK